MIPSIPSKYEERKRIKFHCPRCVSQVHARATRCKTCYADFDIPDEIEWTYLAPAYDDLKGINWLGMCLLGGLAVLTATALVLVWVAI